MIGFLYRLAAGIKDIGERVGISLIIRLGLGIRDRLIKYPLEYF